MPVDTLPGSTVADVRVTAEDGSFVRLRERLGRGALLVVLVAPGTGVWERKHWVTAGIMPRLAASVTALPHHAELLVAEEYPGAAPHTVLLVRPDGHLVTALSGVRPADLYSAAETVLGGPPAKAEASAGSARVDVLTVTVRPHSDGELKRPGPHGVLRIVIDTCVRLWRRVHMDLVRYAGCVCRPSC